MIEAIVKATQLVPLTAPATAFDAPIKRRDVLIVGGTHLIPLSSLVPKYAVRVSILIPSQIPELDREIEMRRAVQLEETTRGFCQGAGFAHDLSGIDTDSVDVLILASVYPAVRDDFLSHAWRIVREFGRVVVFTASEIPLTHLATFGVAAPTYYPVEGFYAGTMRKIAAIRARN